jgi:mycofactocin system glycosyltransferase
LSSGSPAPIGAALVADADTSSYDGGRVLLGGSPRRALRLTDRGADLARALLSGAPIANDVDAALARRLLDAGLAHPATSARASANGFDVVVPAYRAQPLASLPGAVVVDDGSSQPVTGAAVRLPANRGPAAARNAGLAATSAPIVAFVDCDVDVSLDTIGRLTAMLDDPAIAAVAPRILPVGSRLDLGARRGVVRPGARTSYVPSTVLVVRRAAIEAIGGFDEQLRVGEDVDLVWRLVADGWTVRYAPELTARHREPPTLLARLDRSRRYGTAAGPLSRRHPTAPLSPPVVPVAAVVLAGLGRWRSGLVLLAASTVRPICRMRDAGVPTRDATRVATTATLTATSYAARWLTQMWSPLLLGLAARRGRRRGLVLAVAVLALRADDLAYGAGVWAGCLRTRSFRPLLPRRR